MPLKALGGGKPPEPRTSSMVGASEDGGEVGTAPPTRVGASDGNCPGEITVFTSEAGGWDLTPVAAGEMEPPSGTKVGLSESLPLSFGSLIPWFVLA